MALRSLLRAHGVNLGIHDDPSLTNLNEVVGENGEVLFEPGHPLIERSNWDSWVANLQENILPMGDLFLLYLRSHPCASQHASLLVPSIIGSTSSLMNVLLSGNLVSTHQADFDRDRVTFVNDVQELIRFCHQMKNCSWVAIDAEIVGGDTVCVISVSFVDPTVGVMMTIVINSLALNSKIPLLLGPIFLDMKILKIIHSCGSMDSSSLYHSFGTTMRNVIDTQVMYHRIMGPQEYRLSPRIGLIRLLREAFEGDELHLPSIEDHEALKVSWQNSDWSIRPLDTDWVKYAGFDTMRLPSALHWLATLLGDLALPENIEILEEIVTLSQTEAARIFANGQTSPPFECSRLFCAVQRNRMAAHGFGANVDENKFALLSRFLTWRYLMTSSSGLPDDIVAPNDLIMSTVVWYDDAHLSALLDRREHR